METHNYTYFANLTDTEQLKVVAFDYANGYMITSASGSTAEEKQQDIIKQKIAMAQQIYDFLST